ncbi:MAG: nucleotidyltransferase domain-containing protein [Candidatus Omnitrophica bacterium]|nr:nucleotidyltransferase domain-containing protein [Candidatus Omnitrophota bacterium]
MLYKVKQSMYLPAGKERLFRVFFKDPWTELHQRELARRAKVPVHNAHKYLGEFVKDGLLVRREVSPMTFFRPNWESAHLLKIFEGFEVSRREEFFKRNKSIARLLAKATDVLVKESQADTQLVMLFGSVARGTWTPKSDIDLLVLGAGSGAGDLITKGFTKAKAAAQSVLELAPVYNSIEAAVIGFRERRAFYQETWGDRVVLYNEFMFWQIVKRGFLSRG